MPLYGRLLRSPWSSVFGLAIAPLLLGLGLAYLGRQPTTVSDVGTGLVGGSIIGLIFVLAQYTIDQRNMTRDKAADLALTLTSAPELPGIDLSGRQLRGMYLRSKMLQSARLDGADLVGIDLQHTVLKGASLCRARLDGAKMESTDLTAVQAASASLTAASLRDAVLTGGHFREADLTGADLTRAILTGADLSLARLDRATLEDVVLPGASLVACSARRARLARANLAGALLMIADLTGSHLSRAVLHQADLTGADLTGSILLRADLGSTQAAGCCLRGANLTGATLRAANLTSADLSGATVVGCDLRGANLTAARLDGAVGLETVRHDEDTRWPEGYRPGMPAPDLVDPAPAAGGMRPRTVLQIRPFEAGDGVSAGSLEVRLRRLNRLNLARRTDARVSLPLGVRSRTHLVTHVGRARRPLGLRRGTRYLDLTIAVERGTEGTVLRPLVVAGRHRFTLDPVFLASSEPPSSGVEPPNAIEELAAKILETVEPARGRTWRARVHLDRASLVWDRDGAAGTALCMEELRTALEHEPLSAEVNYALGALEYNTYEEAPTRSAVTRFAVAYGAASREQQTHPGLIGLTLSGLSLSLCQLYHRFGDERDSVLIASRTAAWKAVEVTRGRVRSHRGGAQILRPGTPGGTSRRPGLRTALEGFALARYAEAFSQHVTEARADVERSIPLYESAIEALEAAGVPVPAVLLNNLGYQHLTLAGRSEPGPDAERYRTAAQLFDRALNQAPTLQFGWANRGCIQRLTGDFAAAEASYRRAIEVAEINGGTYLQGENELACVLLEAGRGDEAQLMHERAVSRVTSAANRAKMQAEYSQALLLVGRPAAAIESAQRGLTNEEGNRRCRQALEEAQKAL